jgi:hypothetical protein
MNRDLRQRLNDTNKVINNSDVLSSIQHNMTTIEFLNMMEIITEKVSTWKCCNHEILATQMIETLWDTTILSGFLKESIIDKSRKYFRKTIFSPVRIMKLLDIMVASFHIRGWIYYVN